MGWVWPICENRSCALPAINRYSGGKILRLPRGRYGTISFELEKKYFCERGILKKDMIGC